MTKESIIEKIVGHLRHYLDESEKNTLGALAKKTGISKATISRYAQNEVSVNLTADNAFCFLSYFGSQFEAASLMKEAYPKWYESTGRFIVERKRVSMVGKETSRFSSPHSKIFNECVKNGFVTEDEIIERWGREIGIEAANELVEFGFVAKDNTRYTVEESFKDENYISIMKRIELECKDFPVENIGTTAFAWKFSEWMSFDDQEKAYAILRKASIDIRNIVKASYKKKRDTFFKVNLFGNWE